MGLILHPLTSTSLRADDAGAPSAYPIRNDDAILADINRQIREAWTDAGLTPSPAATDGEWCRRVFLDLIGRIPRAEETAKFTSSKVADKRAQLVKELLDSDEYADEYARHWTTVWTNLLVGRSGGMEPRSLVNRDGMQQYLRRSFARNKPYDQLVLELVSADGCNKPGEEDYNGAVNFLLGNLDDDGVQATAKTARLFLGMQVQCTQCHNHPFNKWKQDQFWELNAFFRQTRALRTTEGRDLLFARLADEDFAGEGGNPKEAEVYFELRNGLLKVAYPTFVDGQKINPAGFVDEVNRRDELARLIVQSEYMPTAIVNRMWAHFLGYGFTKPVDDMGPHNPPSHPQLLTMLGQDFVARQYDLKSLMRWIALSEAYSLSSSSTSKNAGDDPALGESPRFSHFYLRQMTAEQLYESLVTAIRADETVQGSVDAQEQLKQDWLRQFVVAFGTDEGDETTTFNGTIPQTLMMMNGDLAARATNTETGGFLDRLNSGKLKDPDKIAFLYQTGLSRAPTRKEASLARELMAARGRDGIGALADIWWAILNSNEFILIH